MTANDIPPLICLLPHGSIGISMGDNNMKRLIAVLLSITLILSATACGEKSDPEISGDPETSSSSDITAASGTMTDNTTASPDGIYIGPTRATEAPDYGDGTVADLCELMHKITGKRVYQSVALVEDFFKAGFETSYMGYSVSYEEDPSGEECFTYYYYMKISTDELAFNRFIFTANEEYGIVHTVEFLNSNSTHDNSLNPSEYTQDDMREYFSRLEKDLTKCLGNPESSQKLDDSNLFAPAYAEYKKGECTFRLEYHSSTEDEVRIKCANSVERKHLIKDTDLEPSATDDDGWADLGDMYYKDSTGDDIVTDENTGIRYVKNQLLVSIKIGTPDAKNKMEEICKEIDADIVGCIEITNDYQIEFSRDMTYDELMQISTELEEDYYFMDSVTLNYATSVGYD